MLQWLKERFRQPQPIGPPRLIKRYGPSDPTITRGVISQTEEGWRVEVGETQTIRLFEVENPQVENCMLTYAAELGCESVSGQCYLEMWCRVPGKGEFFSKGLHNPLKGSRDWASYEIPFYLKRGQSPDLVKLNVVIEGGGKVWIRNIELTYTPLE